MIYDVNNETHEKYIQSLKALDKANKYSEYRKVPDTPEEISFARETNFAMTSTMIGLNISDERWNAIFPGEHNPEAELNDMLDKIFGESTE